MKDSNLIKFITTGGLLTTVTVIFQTAPLYLPAIGLALSPFSTLPIAIAGVFNISLSLYVFITALFIISMVSIQEAFIFFFTTGILGLIIGILIYRKGLVLSIIISSLALSIGIIFLTYTIEMLEFREVANSLTLPSILIILISFSLVYSCVWNVCFYKFMKYINKVITLH